MGTENQQKDLALINEALQGSQKAYETLLRKYQGPIRNLIQRMIHRPEDLDDLVQESFIKAFNALHTYRDDFSFSTWLFKIATNHTIDYIRKKRLPTYSIDKPVIYKDDEIQVELPDQSYNPERGFLGRERSALIEAAIEKLSPLYKEVIIMRHKQDLAYEEIATKLDIPLGTVKARIFRAREQMKKHLDYYIRKIES